jgi:hypothetical protein
MEDAKALRQQSLEAMDRAVLASGTERAVLLAEALRLHARAREAESTAYPAIDDDIEDAAPDVGTDAGDDEALP